MEAQRKVIRLDNIPIEEWKLLEIIEFLLEYYKDLCIRVYFQ